MYARYPGDGCVRVSWVRHRWSLNKQLYEVGRTLRSGKPEVVRFPRAAAALFLPHRTIVLASQFRRRCGRHADARARALSRRPLHPPQESAHSSRYPSTSLRALRPLLAVISHGDSNSTASSRFHAAAPGRLARRFASLMAWEFGRARVSTAAAAPECRVTRARRLLLLTQQPVSPLLCVLPCDRNPGYDGQPVHPISYTLKRAP